MKIIAGMFVVAAGLFILPLLSVFFGAFGGWVVGLFFEETIIGFLRRVGVETAGLQVWEIGAAMGFLGSFLKTSVTNSSK